MQSPHFLRNLALLVLAAANAAVAVRCVMLTGAIAGPATALRVFLRAGSFAYAGASVLVLLLALILFGIFEVASSSRAQWRVLSLWGGVTPGMTPDQVRERLGPPPAAPAPSAMEPTEEVWAYPLHPLGIADEGQLAFGGGKLLRRTPDDEVLGRIRAESWPTGYARSRMIDTLRESITILSFAGLIGLAVASLVPWGAGGRWQSWTLHAPLIGVLLGVLYEVTARKGWRFDLFLLVPAYVVIGGAWALRLWMLLKP